MDTNDKRKLQLREAKQRERKRLKQEGLAQMNVTLSKKLITECDRDVKKQGINRNDFITMLVTEYFDKKNKLHNHELINNKNSSETLLSEIATQSRPNEGKLYTLEEARIIFEKEDRDKKQSVLGEQSDFGF